ncbi:GMP/IMP nucleotidase [Aestuariicella hydrocarbonica]|uniref:GMP/IMP nucleotidase n=1 Tax=Pseudomaricurvus hydrocarbonicus TaxID=1470433 RepID=A0A9E5T1N8_9GAMM|nr:GMP/IMP nucleotidase [Aestuariicella hydrocarbonica]NHO67650.1 GMP/IMP nucleotidase [Aestuariicella hydrocarbonica]
MINWNDIDTVLLDMDGTLLDLHFDNYFWLTHLPKRYAETFGVDEAEAMARLEAHIKAHEGTLKWYCLEFWSESLGLDIRRLKEEVQHKIQIRPFVVEFLKALQAQDKRLVLITNAHPQSLDLKLEVTAIDQWLHMVISSHEFQQPKEAQAFWDELQKREPFDPGRTLFIDDTLRVLDSARDFGIKHLLCLHQPDSQREHRQILEYPAIHHFDEIMPR